MSTGTTVRNPVTDSLTGKALSDEQSVDSSAVAFTLATVPATLKPLEDNTFENTSEPLVVITLPSKPVQPVEVRLMLIFPFQGFTTVKKNLKNLF